MGQFPSTRLGNGHREPPDKNVDDDTLGSLICGPCGDKLIGDDPAAFLKTSKVTFVTYRMSALDVLLNSSADGGISAESASFCMALIVLSWRSHYVLLQKDGSGFAPQLALIIPV